MEIWSDFACPFCYIGKRRFEEGLSKFLHNERVDITIRSFQLDPHASLDGNPSTYELMVQKMGMSNEQASASVNHMIHLAESAGLEYHLDKTIRTNTFDAHRLMHFASVQGKQLQMTERLMKAYFTDTLHIGRHEVLAELAVQVGLNRDESLRILKGEDYTTEVRNDTKMATKVGVRGVPFFLIAGKYAISGAQTSDVFLQELEQAWTDVQSVENSQASSDICTAETGCELPEHNS